jgi:hypothetical protein
MALHETLNEKHDRPQTAAANPGIQTTSPPSSADPLRSTAPHSRNMDRQWLPLVDDMHGEQLA